MSSNSAILQNYSHATSGWVMPTSKALQEVVVEEILGVITEVADRAFSFVQVAWENMPSLSMPMAKAEEIDVNFAELCIDNTMGKDILQQLVQVNAELASLREENQQLTQNFQTVKTQQNALKKRLKKSDEIFETFNLLYRQDVIEQTDALENLGKMTVTTLITVMAYIFVQYGLRRD
ncbi:hypothetical protein COB21_05910 [Candidatus Aerophobetes bacterium]|uniref:Uncharacterized protein n=1 Tax=Aerophobetes bacterium TaxID=2030807 RepID=A0A2A4WYU6_UNCAE|nr:MAG: hypothetical protein COB21_05910 [Candidatus Aerophobetes bacterium]